MLGSPFEEIDSRIKTMRETILEFYNEGLRSINDTRLLASDIEQVEVNGSRLIAQAIVTNISDTEVEIRSWNKINTSQLSEALGAVNRHLVVTSLGSKHFYVKQELVFNMEEVTREKINLLSEEVRKRIKVYREDIQKIIKLHLQEAKINKGEAFQLKDSLDRICSNLAKVLR